MVEQEIWPRQNEYIELRLPDAASAIAFLAVIPAGNLLLDSRCCYLPPCRRANTISGLHTLSSRSRNFYIGMTNDLKRRTATHREKVPGTHTGHYVNPSSRVFRIISLRARCHRRREAAQALDAGAEDQAHRANQSDMKIYTWRFNCPLCRRDQKQIPCGNDSKKGKSRKAKAEPVHRKSMEVR